ncbi:MAG: T9SS type A sorting domain-containing protein [Aureispira sp.]|nr:T9SS type A sorting domain-containing protein [Aureispira sp.]
MNLPNGADFVWPLLIDPVTPTVLYGGGDGVYKSTDRGDTWTLLSATMPNMVQELAVAPSNSNVIFASSDTSYENSLLIATTNGGTTWSNLTSPTLGVITGIAFDPNNAQTVYVTYGRYESGAKVFKSINGGAAWTNISTGLPNLPINCVTTQTGAGGDMYVGTDIGVYHRDNASSSWTAFNTNLPNVIVKDLEISYANNKLRAATFGRGVWESDLNTVATNVERVEAAQDLTLKAYPNPTTGLLNIEIAQEKWMPQQFDVVVYNLTGGVVYNQTNVKRGVHTIDMAHLADGVYFVTIKTPHLIKTERFQLMKK